LNGKNPTYKLIAIEGLARVGDRSRAESIIGAVSSERNDSMVLAGHFAGVLLADAKVDPIVEALGRGKQHDQALQYIEEIAAGRSDALVRHLQDPDVRIRVDLVDAMGLSGDPKALPFVEPLTKDRDAEVARAATRAAARLRGPGTS
jgi:HEAT repeat protein